MEKTILIAGKDLPYGGDFADGMALAGYNVVVTGNPESDSASVTAGDIVIASGNRPSSVSARSLVLQAENAFTVIDETVLYFDAAVYAQQFTALSPEECTRAIDTMIAGYCYVTMEILNRIEQRKANGKLIYIVRHHPNMADVIRSSEQHRKRCRPLCQQCRSRVYRFCRKYRSLCRRQAKRFGRTRLMRRPK